ncbi:MAG: hypothetical protein ACLSA6_12675 [Holdemania massiliensis]
MVKRLSQRLNHKYPTTQVRIYYHAQKIEQPPQLQQSDQSLVCGAWRFVSKAVETQLKNGYNK